MTLGPFHGRCQYSDRGQKSGTGLDTSTSHKAGVTPEIVFLSSNRIRKISVRICVASRGTLVTLGLFHGCCQYSERGQESRSEEKTSLSLKRMSMNDQFINGSSEKRRPLLTDWHIITRNLLFVWFSFICTVS